MNCLLKIFTVAVALVAAIPSFAVTDKEMEQARALAAKHYLRYANNGSDYLDKINPSSVAELSKSLKAKEQENIKSFNAVAVPKDYASWDKKKLVDYWSKTFFNSPGLKDDGKKCLGVLAKNLNKMTVAAPSAAKPAETAQAEAKQAEASQPTKGGDSKTAEPKASPAATPSEANAAAQEKPAAQEDALDAVEVAVAQAQADAGLADDQPKKSSNTGWYIGILVVLVGVVIWLVMYASKSMKETGATLADHKAGEKEIRDAKRAAKEEQNKMREQYASSLTSKNDEIKQLKTRCDALEGQVDAAKREADAYRRELEAAKRELAALRQNRPQPSRSEDAAQARQKPVQSRPAQEENTVPVAAAPVKPQTQSQAQPQAPKAQQSGRPGGLPPVVFLSYVNQKGLFTKASRTLNVEHTVYRMDIPDGHHGKFRVVNDPELLDRFLENPDQWLAGGCVIENPEDADIAAEIVTLQPGEAYFADNTCRVTKKARIKYI